MKLIALAAAAAVSGATPQAEPEVLFVPQGASLTCTAPGGCLVTDRPNMTLLLEQAYGAGEAECTKGRV